MPLLTKALPNLIQGVSQQPDVSRFEGQCETQENALSSVVDGLSKRPPTKAIAELLSSATANNSFVHFINRSSTEKYVIFYNVTTHKLHAYNLDGTEATIDGATGGKTCTEADYLYTTQANTELKALTVGDSTFLLNTQEEPALKTDVSPSLPKEAFGFVKQGDFKKKYGFSLRSAFSSASNNVATVSLTYESYSSGSYKYIRVKSAEVTNGGNFYLSASNTSSVISNALSASQVRDAAIAAHEAAGHGTPSLVKNYNFELPTFTHTVDSTGSINNNVIVASGGRMVRFLSTMESGVEFTRNATVALPTAAASYTTTTGSEAVSTVDVEITSGEGTSASTAENADTTVIMAKLVTDAFSTHSIDATADSNTDFTFVKSNNLVVLTRDGNGIDFDIRVIDGLGGGGFGVGYKKARAITDLPLYCKNGFKIEIIGDEEANADNYWVEFQTTNGLDIGDGTWVESVAPNIPISIEASLMPHELRLTALNTFTLNEMSFANRTVGDLTSNPTPSFIGNNKKISNLFLFKNRLGFICEDNIIMSESGLGIKNESNITEFNFFRTTVQQLLDSDPIDVTVSSGRLTNLKSVIGFQENLILFSDDAQFTLKGGTLLTPSTVAITPITNFEYNANLDPVALGSYLYFPFNRGTKSGIREYTVNSTTDNYDATEITEHIPSYIPSSITQLKGSTSENILIGYAPTEATTLYVYNYFWSGNKKLLSAWSKFTFSFNIIGYDIFDGVLYIIGTKENKTHILSLNLQSSLKDTNMNYNTHLDMRKEHTLSNATSIPLGFTASVGDRVQVWDDQGTLLHDQTLTLASTSVTLSTAHTGTVFSGLSYTMKYVFSEQIFKEASGQSKAPSGFIRAQIRNGVVFFNETRGFKVKVKANNRDETSSVFTPVVVGTSTIGGIELADGHFKFPVFTDAQGTVITIENDSALPANFSSAEFEMFVHRRSNRYG